MNDMTFCRVLASVCIFATFLIFGTGCSSGPNKSDQLKNCVGDQCKKALLVGLEDLVKIEWEEGLSEDRIAAKHLEIQRIVDRFDNPNDLEALALLSKTMARHCSVRDVTCSKQSRVLPTFENSYWTCVKKIAIRRDQNRVIL